MSIRTEAHFKIESTTLADWLERQGLDRWWTVDGDPLLAGRLSFPCPADEIAAELRRLGKPLLVQDRRQPPSGNGQLLAAQELDALATRLDENAIVQGSAPNWTNDRLLCLCWEDRGDDWLLVEDEETTEQSRLDAASAGGGA